MKNLKYPVLLVEDCSGLVTALLVDDKENRAAIANTPREALRLLSEGVEKALEQRTLAEPAFLNPELRWALLDVLPEYSSDSRMQPCAEPVTMRFPCVFGRRNDAAYCCCLPTMGFSFDYFEAKAQEDLVRHFVRSRLQGATPAKLSRWFPPRTAVLDQLLIHQRFTHSKTAKFLPEKEWPHLSAVAESLSSRRAVSGRFDLAFGRELLIKELVSRLQQGASNLLLVGEAGIGKTTIIARVARGCTWGNAVSNGNVEKQETERKEYRFWLTNAAQLISGMKYLGQWEQRCERIIHELASVDGFLCIDNLLDLLTLGGLTAIDSVGAFLLPFLERSELRMISEVTPSELEACRRLLPGLPEVFSIVRVETFSTAQALEVAAHMEATLKTTLKVEAEQEVGAKACSLFNRFMPYQVFPGKAASFIRQLFKQARTEQRVKLSLESVAIEFQRMTGLPSVFLEDEVPLPKEAVVNSLKAKVIGQDTACEFAARVITTFKAGMNDPLRPMAVLLFSGPTGVGKTALAKAIADYLFGNGEHSKRLIRLDMSEYAGPEAAGRLIQSANGDTSELIKQLRQQPFSVVLLDEIEKANPEILDVLMNVFDEGKLSDGRGRITYFRSAMIIMTSNLGSDTRKAIGFVEIQPDYELTIAKSFRPELFNRIDAVVPFKPLDPLSIRKITIKELAGIAQREGLLSAGIDLRWTEAAVDRLATIGFDARYGARPLQRTLEKTVAAPIARLLVENPNLRNSTLIISVADDGRISINVVSRAQSC